jgi:eukaryotic-like serine/threonine-protein kinase
VMGFLCPNPACRAKLKLKPEQVGKRYRCPKCQTTVTVPPLPAGKETSARVASTPQQHAAAIESGEALSAVPLAHPAVSGGPSSARVVLQVTKGRRAGKQLEFTTHEAFVIGREKNKQVQFRIPGDRTMSRYHMLLEVSPPQCFLRDLGSLNGTLVNGTKIRQSHLHDGDVIRAGETEIRVRIEQPPRGGAKTSDQVPVSAGLGSRQSQHIGMSTTVFGTFPGKGGGKALCCSICGEPAHDTFLGDLEDTRILAYVCRTCREEHRTPQEPIPNYRRLEDLGRGALGPVYKAQRINTSKLVALKVLSPDLAIHPGAVQLFVRQMVLASTLKHPLIVPVVEMGQAGDDLWLACEFVDGRDAARLAGDSGGALPPADAVEIVAQTLQALDYAHGLNLVHRDVKPSNILVSGQPGLYSARLADFGLLKDMDDAGVSGITRDDETRGTIPFMAPEQILDCRFVKPVGDVYAAGATLYWLLTGRYTRDFDARDERLEFRDPYSIILEDSIVPIRDRDAAISDSLARVVEMALAREPDDRFQSALEMARALRAAV